MSRSAPDRVPNPSTRWLEWKGGTGGVQYYDKADKENREVSLPFRFVVLDTLATVRGWHEPSQSGIYSNEVRDTRQDVFIVKAFKAGTLAEGLYATIKDRLHRLGGKFQMNCYIAYPLSANLGSMALGTLQFKGAALNAWIEFSKAHRDVLYTKGVRLTGSTTAKKGKVVYHIPTFEAVDITAETQAAALALDTELQAFLSDYLKQTKKEQAERAPELPPEDDAPVLGEYDGIAGEPPDDSEIPF